MEMAKWGWRRNFRSDCSRERGEARGAAKEMGRKRPNGKWEMGEEEDRIRVLGGGMDEDDGSDIDSDSPCARAA